MKKLLLSLLMPIALIGNMAIAADAISVEEGTAWARATPPGARNTAIYLTLINQGTTDTFLTRVSAVISDVPLSDRIELHTHTQVDGLMKMHEVEHVVVPAGHMAKLAPHGDHIMVMDLKQSLKEGDEVELTLTFEDGTTLSLMAPVRKQGPVSDMHHTGAKKKHGKHKNY